MGIFQNEVIYLFAVLRAFTLVMDRKVTLLFGLKPVRRVVLTGLSIQSLLTGSVGTMNIIEAVG